LAGRSFQTIATGYRLTVLGGIDVATVFVIVAVQAEQLPVTAIRRIIIVIVIAVMDRKLT
jgi:hypothetical protein